MKAALTALIVLTAFYLCTATLGFEGPGETLVFRPFHGLYPHYFVLDPDSSRLAVYHGSLPWWQTDSYITLFSTSHETTTAPWLAVYFLGYYATALGWLALLSVLVIRACVARIMALRFHRRTHEFPNDRNA